MDLGNRIKKYEYKTRIYLNKKRPIIIRLDGRTFHNFTKKFKKPFDLIFINTMWQTAQYLCANISGCKIAYVQSDEISLLLNNYENPNTETWFGGNVQKIVSISASIATLNFNYNFKNFLFGKYSNSATPIYISKIDKAMFDSRVFNLSKNEVCNYFIWRQLDCIRNSINSIGRHYFNHKQMQNKNCEEIKNMLQKEKGIIIQNDYKLYEQRGACIIKQKYMKENPLDSNLVCERTKWIVDDIIPNFTEDKNYIEKYI